MRSAVCLVCGKGFKVCGKRVGKYCSGPCYGKAKSVEQTGAANTKYRSDVVREKVCKGCSATFRHRKGQPVVSFERQKFCTKACADVHGFRRSGEAHPLYKPDSRRKNRRGKHGSWARAVLGRDRATCRHCGATGVELHAHHIKPFAEYPELRWELSNGITLCHRCHWQVHTVVNAKAVNSGNTVTGNADGNPEPSFGRKPVEGVTIRGRAYRRFDGKCENCGIHISKRWSDAVGKRHLFCSKHCSGKFQRRVYGPVKKPMAVISSTNAAPERDDMT